MYSQIDASLKAGVDMNTIEYNIETESIKYNSLLAGHFGINLDVALGNTSYIRSGLIYNLKGEKTEFSIFEEKISAKTYLHYVDIPFHYLHYFTAKKEGFFVELGPGLGYYFGATFVDSGPNTKNSLFTFLQFILMEL